jgi:hypothetical protein
MKERIYILELTDKQHSMLMGVFRNPLNEIMLSKYWLGTLRRIVANANWKEHNAFDTPRTKENYPNSLAVKTGYTPIGDLEPWTDKDSIPTEERLVKAEQELEDPMAYSQGHKNTLRFARVLMNLIRKLQG